MAPEAEGRGASVEEAVEAALSELGVAEQQARVEVVQEPSEGIEAVVLVRASTGSAEPDDLEEQADAAADFVEELLGLMGIDAIAEPSEHAGHMYVDVGDGSDDDMSLLIGHHGQTLEAIQELTRMIVGRRLDERIRVVVDVEGYRKRRESRLEERARELADRVSQTGREEELEAMNAYERKIVHDAIGGVAGVESISRGEEPNRYVVIRRR